MQFELNDNMVQKAHEVFRKNLATFFRVFMNEQNITDKKAINLLQEYTSFIEYGFRDIRNEEWRKRMP